MSICSDHDIYFGEKTILIRRYIETLRGNLRSYMERINSHTAEIKRLKQDCDKGVLRLGCTDSIRDMLENLDLRNGKMLEHVVDFSNTLNERLYERDYDWNKLDDIKNIYKQETKKMEKADQEYKNIYNKMYDFIDDIPQQEVEETLTPINTPSPPHTPDTAAGKNRKKSRRTRCKKLLKKKKRRIKTKRKRKRKKRYKS
jgi:hypothetical protein